MNAPTSPLTWLTLRRWRHPSAREYLPALKCISVSDPRQSTQVTPHLHFIKEAALIVVSLIQILFVIYLISIIIKFIFGNNPQKLNAAATSTNNTTESPPTKLEYQLIQKKAIIEQLEGEIARLRKIQIRYFAVQEALAVSRFKESGKDLEIERLKEDVARLSKYQVEQKATDEVVEEVEAGSIVAQCNGTVEADWMADAVIVEIEKLEEVEVGLRGGVIESRV